METLHDVGFGSDFLDDTKSTSNKRKNRLNWASSDLENFCASKDTIKRMKKQLTEWKKERICKSYI